MSAIQTFYKSVPEDPSFSLRFPDHREKRFHTILQGPRFFAVIQICTSASLPHLYSLQAKAILKPVEASLIHITIFSRTIFLYSRGHDLYKCRCPFRPPRKTKLMKPATTCITVSFAKVEHSSPLVEVFCFCKSSLYTESNFSNLLPSMSLSS